MKFSEMYRLLFGIPKPEQVTVDKSYFTDVVAVTDDCGYTMGCIATPRSALAFDSPALPYEKDRD